MSVNEIANTLRTLTADDMVEVTYRVRGADKTRAIRVTQISDGEYGYSVYTTSGRVRPGHVAGGELSLGKRDDRIFFQPTMSQDPCTVSALCKLGLAN